MKLDEYATYDAIGLMQLVKRGEISPHELQKCALEGIERTNSALNFMAGSALTNSTWVPDKPFSGLPFLLKEGHGLAGGSLAMGSRLTAGLKSPHDSELTTRFKQAGVAILGETTASEFGIAPITTSNLYGVTRNPWNLDHSPGGSSGGSSVAVAAGIVPVAQTADGGGSIRIPAHCTGIFGLKPSRWRTPEIKPGVFPLGHFHVSSRTVRDSAAFLDVTMGDWPGAPCRIQRPERPYLEEIGRPLGRLRIAISRKAPGGAVVAPECLAALDRAANLAQSLGHHVEEAEPTLDWKTLFQCFITAWFHAFPVGIKQISAMTGRKPGADTLDASTLRGIELGPTLTVDDIVIANAHFRAAHQLLDQFFLKYDIWMTPSAVCQAPTVDQFDPRVGEEISKTLLPKSLLEFAAFSPLFNITGHPAASVPIHHGVNGLPAGVQIIGPTGDDATVLSLSAQFESADPWINRRAPHSIFSIRAVANAK
jgi:amidase